MKSQAAMSWRVLPLLLLLACAAKQRAPAPPIEPAPAWATPEGQREARAELVESMLQAHQSEAALRLLNQMRASGADEPDLDVLQARALRQIGLREDALALLDTRRHRRDAAAQNELGILAMDEQDITTAIERFRRAKKLDADNPDYPNNLGFALMSAGRPGEAIAVLREALQRDATRARTRNNLGFALVADGLEQEAYRVFRSATSEDEARYNLGVGLELRGDTALAADAYASALRINPEHTRAREALDRIYPLIHSQPSETP